MPRTPDSPRVVNSEKTSAPTMTSAQAQGIVARGSNPPDYVPQPNNNYWLSGSSWGPTPVMGAGLTFRELGNSGLRVFSGYVREEFLPQLVGRQAARVYREMVDNDATVSAIMFAITQTMRQAEWHVDGVDDSAESQQYVEFVESVMEDMSDSWGAFITEALSMLPYGFAPHEIIYKRRQGRNPGIDEETGEPLAPSAFNDGKIGLRKIPLRGQDTVIKWFFDSAGDIAGLTQQPWIGPMVDIPAEKLLLFRPRVYKNNPEGYSVLRGSYRAYYFIKRLQEQEAIMFERFAGFPVMTVPNALLEAAAGGDAVAIAALSEYKKIVTNARIDEQMGAIIPSDTFRGSDGSPTAVPMYDFKLVSPQQSRAAMSADQSIERYKLEIMTCVLADFLQLGHSARGNQGNSATKVDLFFQAIEGWMDSIADVLNKNLLPRLWALNGFPEKMMPHFRPDVPQRTDLDNLSNFVFRLGQSGLLTADANTETYLRDVAGLPDLSPEDRQKLLDEKRQNDLEDQKAAAEAKSQARPERPDAGGGSAMKKLVAEELLRGFLGRKGDE